LGALGMVYLDISEEFTDRIAEFHNHALRLLESPAGAMSGGTAWADLCLCALTLGDLEVAEESLQKGMNYPNTHMWLERPRNLAGAALLALAKGDLDEALSKAEEGRAFAEERQMRHLYPLTALVKGKVLLARGEIEASLESLEQAEAEAQSMGMRPYIWQAQAASAEALEAAGLVNQATAARAQAEATAVEIADLFDDQELRQAYLRNVLPKIR
jgi:ATP/maltotriose-dependent transcriptional regulator MalT